MEYARFEVIDCERCGFGLFPEGRRMHDDRVCDGLIGMAKRVRGGWIPQPEWLDQVESVGIEVESGSHWVLVERGLGSRLEEVRQIRWVRTADDVDTRDYLGAVRALMLSGDAERDPWATAQDLGPDELADTADFDGHSIKLRCGRQDHRLCLERGILIALDHEAPTPTDTPCGAALDRWAKAPEPFSSTLDLSMGPPNFQRPRPAAPAAIAELELSVSERILDRVERALHDAGLGFVRRLLGTPLVGIRQIPQVVTGPMFVPTVGIALRPDWPWRVARSVPPVLDERFLLDLEERGGSQVARVTSPWRDPAIPRFGDAFELVETGPGEFNVGEPAIP